MKFKLLRLNAAGDTIIEVLIVVAVLGLAFAFSLATATKGLAQARNAEEHAQAQGHLSSQIELLRSAVVSHADVYDDTVFCMNGLSVVKFAATYSVSDDSRTDSSGGFSGYPSQCRQGQYNISVKYVDNTDPSRQYFQLRVRWDGVAGLGVQQESFTYRLHTTGSGP